MSADGWAAGALAWLLAWLVMLGLDDRIDLAHQALLLVLGGALAALWWPAWATLAAGALGVLAFNALLVPPRGSLWVERWQDGLLLTLMAATLGVVLALITNLRHQAREARLHQARAEQLRQLGEVLRDAAPPLAHAAALQQALAALTAAPATLLLCRRWQPGVPLADDDAELVGTADADEAAGLWLGLRQARALGPGTGHHAGLAHWILPLRGGAGASRPAPGAALLRPAPAERADAALRAHAQALCDQLGVALQRHFSQQAADDARAQAQLQAVRNALLTAISHDYRTPLATILGAASSLQDQGQRLDAQQRGVLAGRIVQEANHLARLTDNTLQLARLDAPGVVLRRDWESAEELVGAVLRRARQRAPDRPLRARLEPGLPLLHCDAMLLIQLLDNLVDNAIRHTPPDGPIELLVRRAPGAGDAPPGVVLAVRDRGPGVPPAWRERIFEVFQRGDTATGAPPQRHGTGVGLAVCRAIARAHGGELRLQARGHGGSSFECHLPGAAQPAPGQALA
ncbi:MAG TPA: ATP-binding protein [Aquabacterium sp.]|nr:ATP-binding protein [Aquabacterium sp.]